MQPTDLDILFSYMLHTPKIKFYQIKTQMRENLLMAGSFISVLHIPWLLFFFFLLKLLIWCLWDFEIHSLIVEMFQSRASQKFHYVRDTRRSTVSCFVMWTWFYRRKLLPLLMEKVKPFMKFWAQTDESSVDRIKQRRSQNAVSWFLGNRWRMHLLWRTSHTWSVYMTMYTCL